MLKILRNDEKVILEVVVVVVVVYFDKKYIEHKAHIKCTNVKNYKTHVHKMKAKCHVISTRDSTKSK